MACKVDDLAFRVGEALPSGDGASALTTLSAANAMCAQPRLDPELPALAKVINAFEVGFQFVGADPYYGRHLPAALAAGGLVDIGCEARVPVVFSGTPMVEFMELSLEPSPRAVRGRRSSHRRRCRRGARHAS